MGPLISPKWTTCLDVTNGDPLNGLFMFNRVANYGASTLAKSQVTMPLAESAKRDDAVADEQPTEPIEHERGTR